MRPRFISPMELKIEELRIDPPAPNIDLSFVFSLNSSDFCGNCVALKLIFVFYQNRKIAFSQFFEEKKSSLEKFFIASKELLFPSSRGTKFFFFLLWFCFPLVFFYRFNSFLCSLALNFSLFSIELFFFFYYFSFSFFYILFFLSFFLLPLCYIGILLKLIFLQFFPRWFLLVRLSWKNYQNALGSFLKFEE